MSSPPHCVDLQVPREVPFQVPGQVQGEEGQVQERGEAQGEERGQGRRRQEGEERLQRQQVAPLSSHPLAWSDINFVSGGVATAPTALTIKENYCKNFQDVPIIIFNTIN